MYITAQGPRLRNDLYCVEWDVKLYHTIPYCGVGVRKGWYTRTRIHTARNTGCKYGSCGQSTRTYIPLSRLVTVGDRSFAVALEHSA